MKMGLLRQSFPDSPPLPIVLGELTQVFKANRMDPRSPLSSISYGAWRESIQRTSESVQEISLAGGSKALTLTTEATGPFPVNAIIQGQLIVRHSDLHPIEQHLKVQGENGVLDYALTEKAFEVLTLTGLPPMLFADLTPPVTPQIIEPAPVPPPIVPVLVPSSSDLTAAEVESMMALHRTKACLGGRVSTVRVDSARIEVRGVADSVERKQEIQAALEGIPWVNGRILTVEEASNADPSASPDSTGSQNEIEVSNAGQLGTMEIQRGKLPIQDLLEKYFTESRQAVSPGPNEPTGVGEMITTLSNKAVFLSEAALEEAWALRRLAEWSLSLKTEELRPSTRWILEVMVREHMTGLRTQIDSSRQLLEPILSSRLLEGEPSAPSLKDNVSLGSSEFENTSWVSDSLQLFATVERIVHLSLGLFADTSSPMHQPETAMRELGTLFRQWESQFQILEGQVARSFPGNPDSLTLRNPTE